MARDPRSSNVLRLPVQCERCQQAVEILEKSNSNWDVEEMGDFMSNCIVVEENNRAGLEPPTFPWKGPFFNSSMAKVIAAYRRRL
jgi:hypothetical protein